MTPLSNFLNNNSESHCILNKYFSCYKITNEAWFFYPASTQPPTPDPLAAPECDPSVCVLPECFCSSDGTRIPGDLEPSETPQMILMSFDGAINALNFDHYKKLLSRTRTNPNGCQIKGTFFVSHEYTSHFHVQKFYADGHEIAVHSIR